MFPQSLRGRLILLLLVAVAAPIIIAGYFMIFHAEQALVFEKQQKLYGAARMLDEELRTTYDDLLRNKGLSEADRDTKILALNKELREVTDRVAEAYPGIGVGYYSKELDAIITYGPSDVYNDRVGLAISQDHEGRIVMATGKARVQEGLLVRGSVMNAMQPITRDQQVIGYIWANELSSSITSQFFEMKRKIYITILLSLLLGLGGIVLLVNRFGKDLERITQGVDDLKTDLRIELPPMEGEVGQLAAAVNEMAKDLAARKELENQVQAAERLAAVGEVAAGLAHEIRNPLMAIKGFAELLDEEITQEEKSEYVEIIVRETDRLNHLIEELLCLARPSESVLEPISVKEVLFNTLRLLETKTLRNHIELVREIDDDLPLVFVEGERLKQVFVNLLINAIQAITDRGQIRITTWHDSKADLVVVQFTDTGRGISPENLSKLFDPFFTTKANGTGLGLSVAHRLVHNWGGKISVESIEGQGSTFTVSLPVAGVENI